MKATFRQLRLFLALAETGSITAAARVSHVTQPTASMQLRELAQAIGQPLYEVIARRVYLTDTGKELAATVRAMVQAWDAFEQGVDAAAGLTRGKLRVSVVSTAQYFMPRLIGAFCRQHPGIDVSLEVLNRNGVVQRLRENLDDLYIMSMPPDDLDLEAEVFMANPLVLVTAATDRRLRDAPLSLQQLAGQPFVLREAGSGTRMAADLFFRRQRFRPEIRLELGSNEAIKEAVAGGLGVSVLSRHALHGRDREYGVSVLDVKGFPLASQWHIVHPAGKRLSPVAAAFRARLLDESAAKKAAR